MRVLDSIFKDAFSDFLFFGEREINSKISSVLDMFSAFCYLHVNIIWPLSPWLGKLAISGKIPQKVLHGSKIRTREMVKQMCWMGHKYIFKNGRKMVAGRPEGYAIDILKK